MPDEIDSLRLDLDVRAMLGGAELAGRDKLGDRPLDAERRRFVNEMRGRSRGRPSGSTTSAT